MVRVRCRVIVRIRVRQQFSLGAVVLEQLLKYPIKLFTCRVSLIFIMELSENEITIFPPTLISALPLIFPKEKGKERPVTF